MATECEMVMAGDPQAAGAPKAQGQGGKAGAAAKHKKRDLRDRPPEYTQFDALDGPCARFFHRFYARRIVTIERPNPYPPVIGHIYRLCRTLDVADPWELIVLGSFPLWFALVFSYRLLHIPGAINGLLIAMLGVYIGYWFVLMVFLDRRLDWGDLQHIKHVRHVRQQARSDRLARRREAIKNLPELREKAQEARRRGEQRAAAAPPREPVAGDAAPVPPVPPALDELLEA